MPAGGCAVVVRVAGAQGDERAVPPGAKLDVEARGGGGMSEDELLRPVERQAHRPADPERDQRQQRLQEHHLAAEATADRHRHDANLVRGESGRARDRVADDERPLGRRPYGQPAFRLGARHGDVRLQERMVGAADAVGGADHDVRLLQRGGRVPTGQVRHAGDVPRPVRRSLVGAG